MGSSNPQLERPEWPLPWPSNSVLDMHLSNNLTSPCAKVCKPTIIEVLLFTLAVLELVYSSRHDDMLEASTMTVGRFS